MDEQKEKEGKIVMEMQIGNAKRYFNDAYIIKDKEEVKRRIKDIERIIYDGIKKTPPKKDSDINSDNKK